MPTFNVLSAVLIILVALMIITSFKTDYEKIMSKQNITKKANRDLSVLGQYSERSVNAVENLVYNALATAFTKDKDLAPKVYDIAFDWVATTMDPYGYFALGVERARESFSKIVMDAQDNNVPINFKVHLGAYRTPAKSLLYNDRLDVYSFINKVNDLLEVSS